MNLNLANSRLTNLCKLVLDRRVQIFIGFAILINAVVLGLGTFPDIRNNYGFILRLIDDLILIIFAIEMAMKLIVMRNNFWKDNWNIFDFFIVLSSLITFGASISILRSLRVLRILRSISIVPRLRKIVEAMLHSIPEISWLSLLMLLIVYVFAVIASYLYGELFPQWFGNLGKSSFTLFQILTLESWSMGIVRPVMEKSPYAACFFIPYILLCSYVILNLFIAILVNSMDRQEHIKDTDTHPHNDNTNDAKIKDIVPQASEKDVDIQMIMEKIDRISADIDLLKNKFDIKGVDTKP